MPSIIGKHAGKEPKSVGSKKALKVLPYSSCSNQYSPVIKSLLKQSSGQSFQKLKQEFSNDEDYDKILAYVATVFTNCGNYYSFGDNKFLCDSSQGQMEKLIKLSVNYQSKQWKPIMDELWNYVKEPIFKTEGRWSKLGLSDGLSGYYSPNLTKEELDVVDEFLDSMNISQLNTRVFKEKNVFKVMVASANKLLSTKHLFKKHNIEIHYGDFCAFLSRLVEYLSNSQQYAANKNQTNMLKYYIQHFLNGNVDAHKDSQRWWIQDTGPVVESNIGFIETYMDPKQVRAEFEGFVALVDKKLSEQTDNLLSQAEQFIAKLPWPKEFEKDKFHKPDFTSLQVLGFGCSGTPLGINIPNYDDIRQEEGFKNVHLGNTVPKIKNLMFIEEEDQQICIDHFAEAMFHQVIYHELLGHGSGKLFQGNNYDPNTMNPITNQPVGNNCYQKTDTWNSKFQALSNPYEECRADSVALYYACFPEAFEVLQPKADPIKTMQSCFINFVYQGIIGLQYFNAEYKKWGQAHINGRFVILQVLMEAGVVVIEECKKDEKDWIKVNIKKNELPTVGKKAISDFLVKIQVFKSTGDLESAKKMFQGYSEVSEKFMRIREIVIENRKPRRLELQGNLMDANSYKSYDENFEGIIESYIDRYPLFDVEMYELWKKQSELMRPNL